MRDGALLEAEGEAQAAPMFKVVLLNDDYTPWSSSWRAAAVLSMTREKATQIMLKVHREGMGICGVYPRTSRTPKSTR